MKELDMLEIKNLIVQIEDKRILNGLNLTVNTARSRPSWGRTGPASRRCPTCIAGKEDYEVLDGEVLLNGENLLEMEPRRARRRRRVPRLPVSARNSRRRHDDLPEGGA